MGRNRRIILTRTLALSLLLIAASSSLSANPVCQEKPDSSECKSSDEPGLDLTRATHTALSAQLLALSEFTPTSSGETDALKLVAGRFERIALRSIEARSAWLAAGSCGGSPADGRIALEQMAEALREVRAARKELSEKGSPFSPAARTGLGQALDHLEADLNVALMDSGTGGGSTCRYDLNQNKCTGTCSKEGTLCKQRSDIIHCECKPRQPCP